MIDHLLQSYIKIGILVTSSIVGLATVESAVHDTGFGGIIDGLERFGSFFLVAVFVLVVLWGLSKTIPLLIHFLERTKDQFIAELKDERLAREKSVEMFREMLSTHRNELGEKLDEGNRIIRELVDELKRRPCQK